MTPNNNSISARIDLMANDIGNKLYNDLATSEFYLQHKEEILRDSEIC